MKWNQEIGKIAVERMHQRASCRVFTEEKIPDEILKDVLQAGIRAASGGNLQPYSIIVVKDEEKNKELARLCGNQQFIGSAPINLIFLLDFYKLKRWTELEKAPFTSDKSYMPFLIGLEDVICAAQAIETAAWQMGIGSVYIGTVNGAGKELAELYNLPKYTYPVVILTMGYSKNELPLRERLPYEFTVFEERYPDFTDEDILEGFGAKYQGRSRQLPTAESAQTEWLDRFKEALTTTFTDEEIEEIIGKVREEGVFKLSQYIFGMHYHAKFMLDHGREVLKMMKEQGLEPFSALTE